MILSSPKHIYNHIDRCRRDIIANNVPHTRTYLSYWEGKTFIWFWQTLSKRYRMTCSCHQRIMVAIYITICLFPFFYLEIYCKEKYLAQWYEEIFSFQTWPSFMLNHFLHLRCTRWRCKYKYVPSISSPIVSRMNATFYISVLLT